MSLNLLLIKRIVDIFLFLRNFKFNDADHLDTSHRTGQSLQVKANSTIR